MKPILRGDVFRVDLSSIGAAEWGERPVLVVSNDHFNAKLNTVVVVTLTSKDRSHHAGCVRIPRQSVAGSPGLSADSYAVCHSPFTVPQEEMREYLGRLTHADVLNEIGYSLAFVLDYQSVIEIHDLGD